MVNAQEAREMSLKFQRQGFTSWHKFWLGREVNTYVTDYAKRGKRSCQFATDHAHPGAKAWLESYGYDVDIRSGVIYGYIVDLSW